MKVIQRINAEILGHLEDYRKWAFSDEIRKALQVRLESRDSRLKRDEHPDRFCSAEHLVSIDAANHSGFPDHWFGVDLNYKIVQNESAQYDPSFFEQVREMNALFDDRLQTALGAKACALKAFYPRNGYIPWHTNWNTSSYILIFSYSPTGKGYWRHVDATGARSLNPDPQKIVHIDDVPGWHCKAGYFGNKTELEKVVWHCALTSEPRITLSYIIPELNLWKSMVAELEG